VQKYMADSGLDYDPEDDVFTNTDEDDSSIDEDQTAHGGREHYEAVRQSKLRTPAQPELDPKYDGVAVSRNALNGDDDDDPFAPVEEEEDDDPFGIKSGDGAVSDDDTGASETHNIGQNGMELSVDEDEEIESDEAFGEDDEERFKNFKFLGSKSRQRESKNEGREAELDEDDDATSEDDIEEDGTEVSGETEETDVEMEDDDDDEDNSEMSSISSAASLPTGRSKPTAISEREELRRLATMPSGTAALASALSASANADIHKGQAVKKQQQIFDRLLDARIKLQKGLTAANQLDPTSISDEEVKSAAKKAEEAARALWSTIDSIRCDLLAPQSSLTDKHSPSKDSPFKRKRPFVATSSTSLSEIWDQSTSLEAYSLPYRRANLDKWHAKTQPVIDTRQRSNLFSNSQQPSRSKLTDVLDTYLATESDKLVAASTTTSTTTLQYDDNTFYQSLLRDLITSRASTGASTGQGELYIPVKLHPSGSKNKNVDTKASKGRKVRYTVHEKLENFMATEDRTTWPDAARTEFFGSLFGQSRALDENDEDEDRDEVSVNGRDEDERRQVQALKLFRT